jgi:3-hydroxy-9,10-secoandrosta-1,3,5(10)-triene-9,17-dione monooxygenase
MLERGSRCDLFTELDRARYQRDRAFITKLCLQAVNRVFEASGGHALFQSDAMQRFHRDAHAATHRETMLLDLAGQAFARLTLA